MQQWVYYFLGFLDSMRRENSVLGWFVFLQIKIQLYMFMAEEEKTKKKI